MWGTGRARRKSMLFRPFFQAANQQVAGHPGGVGVGGQQIARGEVVKKASGRLASRTVFEQCIEILDRPGPRVTELHLDDKLVAGSHVRARLHPARRTWLQVRLQVFVVGGFECDPGRRLRDQHQPQGCEHRHIELVLEAVECCVSPACPGCWRWRVQKKKKRRWCHAIGRGRFGVTVACGEN